MGAEATKRRSDGATEGEHRWCENPLSHRPATGIPYRDAAWGRCNLAKGEGRGPLPVRGAFSLVELVIVIVIIAVIAAIAIPRVSRGVKGATDSTLAADVSAMRRAISLYAAEHGGAHPTVSKFVEQLTTYTDDAGGDAAAKDTTHIYGPYLKAIPGLPVDGEGVTGGKKGDTGVAAADGAGVGWIYDATAGDIHANTGVAADEAGTLYSDY